MVDIAKRRIIPALAGNTALHDPMMGRLRDHPRSRGEYLVAMLWPQDDKGIIPALAGNTPSTAP